MPIAKRPPPYLFKLSTNAWTQPFWDATARHVLLVARCAGCGHCRMPPTPFCPACQSQAIDWKPVSGRGEVYSYTVVERAILPDMQAHLPYVPAVITLDDGGGVRLISNVVEAEVSTIRVGLPVQLVWDDLPGGALALPRFRPLPAP